MTSGPGSRGGLGRRAGSGLAPGRPWRRRAARTLIVAGTLAGAFVGVMGFLHTPYGRPLMARLGMSCPARRVTPAQAEALRVRAVDALRGKAPAPSRPALGLALDVSRPAEVSAWAQARGLPCVSKERPSRMITCANVPAAALSRPPSDGIIDEVTFAFAPDGRLVSVDSLRRTLSAGDASRLFGDIADDLAAKLGSNGARVGEPTPAYLGSGMLHTARVQYRFADYLATVTAMNLSGRVALREQYESARGG
jgi:hypothetical protein